MWLAIPLLTFVLLLGIAVGHDLWASLHETEGWTKPMDWEQP